MAFQGDSIFWVDTEKVVPNPFQPRREFDQNKLQELSESIRMYGVLQPLTVTRSEVQRDDGTFYTEYELIAGERRLRASRLAGVAQVPVIIREGEQNEQEKLELAIIENLQREDLNAIDRALAFQQLAEQFELSHTQVAQKVGRSREYVSNSIRLLALPEHMRLALQRGELGEGHARTLLMLTDRPQEQETIFREILLKKMSVREVERIVRKIATDKVRKKQDTDIGDHLIEIEKEFTETLGTRVQIQKTEFGGKLTIDYFSEDDLSALLKRMQVESGGNSTVAATMAAMAAATPLVDATNQLSTPAQQTPATPDQPVPNQASNEAPQHWNQQSVAEPSSHSVPESVIPSVSRESFAAASYDEVIAEQPQSYVPPQPPVAPERDPVPPQAADAIVHPQAHIHQTPPPADSAQPVAKPLDTADQSGAPTPSASIAPEPVVEASTSEATEQEPVIQPPEKDVQSSAQAQNPDTPAQRFFHNAFGFSRPAPEAEPVEPVASPAEESITQTQSEVAASERVEQQPATQSSPSEPEEPKDDDVENIYSIRHFSI